MPDQTEHPHYAEDAIQNVETHHEESDVDIRGLVWFTVAFVAFAVVMHIALWLLFRFYVQLERGNTNAPLTAVARSPEANVPPSPRLQPFPTKTGQEVIPPYSTTPVRDLQEMRANEDQVLNSYGWVDRNHGIVHIPIEQAKQLALQSNVYQVNTGAAAASTPAPPVTTTAVTPATANTGTQQ